MRYLHPKCLSYRILPGAIAPAGAAVARGITGLGLILLLAFAVSQPARAATILVVGDSLSAAHGINRDDGWINLMRKRLETKAPGEHTVINASISGDTTAGGLERLPRALKEHVPDIVLLEMGGNDGLQGLPPERMQRNLAQMIEKSQAAGAHVALLGILVPPNYGNAYTQAFANVYPTLSQQYDIPLVPFILEGVALNDKLMQDDQIHPNAQGQPIILDNIWPTVETLLDQASSNDHERANGN